MNTETKKIVTYSEEEKSDYQTLISQGWIDTGKAPSPFKFLDKRYLERSELQAYQEKMYVKRLKEEKEAKLTNVQKRIRHENNLLASRGWDVMR